MTCITSKTIQSMKNYKLIGIIPFSESFFIPTVPPVYRTRTSEDLAGVMLLITKIIGESGSSLLTGVLYKLSCALPGVTSVTS